MENNELRDEKIKWIILGLHLKGDIIDVKEGTYGTVFIVDQQKGTPRYVAYKTIREKIQDIQSKKFVREVKQWFKIRGHPLILTPFYIRVLKGLPFICMPFCEMDLQVYMEKREKIDAIEALVYIAQILKGLIFARKRGIQAHQDLKPRNILLEKRMIGFPPEILHPSLQYSIRIADFGNANAWIELGKPFGTKSYMAPEQFMKVGDFSKVDVFAVGVILHELLTGRHPIGEKTSNLWPWKEGIPRKYMHDRPWKKWAKNEDKQIR